MVEEFVAVWNDGNETSFRCSRDEIYTYVHEVWTPYLAIDEWIEGVVDTTGEWVDF